MKLKFLLFSIIFLLPFFASAQSNYTITGKVVDTASLMNMGYTSITAINKSDSVLQDFTRANEDGLFTLNVKHPGDYILLYAHPTFANFIGSVTVNQPATELGDIPMISKQNLLQEVIVMESRSMVIKGDTVEYSADSFKVREFASVEELLKKLPGIEVDQKGNITAHGEKVQKMLVDGDEFFADDPAVLSKMLRAAAIDKVQVFDKKSDEAQFTGIDDGTKIKTINLTLKDNAKRGYFGKVVLGGGLPKFYENQLMINAFKDKRKISAYAIMSNTNNVGLGWDDASKYGGGRGFFSSGEDEDASPDMSSFGGGDNGGLGGFGGSFSGEGLPKSISAGVHFGNKFGKNDNTNLNADYRVNNYSLNVIKDTRTQYIMPDTQYVNNNSNRNTNTNLMNSLNGRVDVTIDSLSSMIVNASGSINKSNSNSLNTANYTTMDGQAINDSKSETQKESTRNNASVDLSYRKKFMTPGRTFSITLNGAYSQSAAESNFISENNFYTTGTQQHFNQRKTDSTLALQGKVRLSYTEPLIKDKLHLVLNAYSNYIKNTSSNLSFDRIPNTETDTFNTLYSSNYDYSVFTNSAGANIRFKKDQLKFSLGGNVAFAKYQNSNNFTGALFERNYVNFFPRASFNYSHKRSSNFGFNYNGSTTQPRIDQIQVMVQNTDPLNIRLGNPNLVQAFNHRFSVNFNHYKILSESYVYGNLGYNLTQNALGEKQNISADGVNTYQTVNINGNWNSYAYAGYSAKIKPIKTRVGFGVNANYGNNNSYLNDVLNSAKNTTLGLRLDMSFYKDSLMDISYSVNPTYNYSKSSVNTNATNEFFMTRQEFDMSLTLPKGFELGFDFNWLLRQKTAVQDRNNNIFLANAYLSKSLLKDRSLALRLEGNDLFNRNVGFSRDMYGNSITESTYNNIRRYFLLKLTWNFTYTKAMSGKGAGQTGNTEQGGAEQGTFEITE